MMSNDKNRENDQHVTDMKSHCLMHSGTSTRASTGTSTRASTTLGEPSKIPMWVGQAQV